MMRIWIAVLPVLLLLAGCGGEKDAGYVARKLDIVLPQPAAVTSGDSHGGFHGDFHGDGLLHMELTFSQPSTATIPFLASTPATMATASPTNRRRRSRISLS